MKIVLLSLILLVSSYATAQNKVPKTVVELEKKLENLKEPLDRILFLKQVLQNSKIDSIQATSHYKLARVYYAELKEMDSALHYIQLLEDNYEVKTYPSIFYKTTLYKGNIYDELNEPEKALKFYEQSLKITDKYKDYSGTYFVCNSMAILYRKQSDTLKALEYYNKAVKNGMIAKINVGPVFNNIGVLHFKKNKDTAIHYFRKALQMSKENNYRMGEKMNYFNLAHAYLRKEKSAEYYLALDYLNKASAIALDTKSSQFYINFYYGLYYEKTNNFSQAQKYYQLTLQDPERLTDPVQFIKVLEQIAAFYEGSGLYEKAVPFFKKYHSLKDSIYSVEKNIAFNTIRTQYEVEKKDSSILLLQKENDLKATRQKLIVTTAILVSIGLMSLFLFYKHRARTQQLLRHKELSIYNTEKESLQKTKELAEIKALVQGRDKERHRIATELHDGVGGRLSGVHLSLSTLSWDLKNSHLNLLSGYVKESLEDIRTLSHGLSNNYLTDKSLVELVVHLKKETQQKHKISMELSFFPEDSFKELNSELKHHLYRITQELCNNTIKHAQASHITLSISMNENDLLFLFEDDGKGYEISKEPKGIGMNNIKERTNILNAILTVDSHVRRGTHITIEIPLS